MIQLRKDCLFVAQDGGGAIPCSVDQITLEIIGDAAGAVDPEVLRHAAAGVLHYFKDEQGRDVVTMDEFAEALARVLAGFGLTVEVTDVRETGSTVHSEDLRMLACHAGKLGELEFFPLLRAALKGSLEASPRTVEFRGLRGAVKLLRGRKHWTRDCSELEERIVDALRNWWCQEHRDSALVVR